MTDLGGVASYRVPSYRKQLDIWTATNAVAQARSVRIGNFVRWVPVWRNGLTGTIPLLRYRADGVLAGTVTENGTPIPYAVVAVYYRPTMQLITAVRCDASGTFSVPRLDPADTQAYFVVAFDPDGGTLYNALIYDRLTPVGTTIDTRTVSAVGSESFVSGNHTMIPYYGWNPADKHANVILSDSNFTAVNNTSTAAGVRGLTYKTSGKWYVEFLNSGYGGGGFGIGVSRATASLSTYLGADSNGWGCGHSGLCYTSGALVGGLSLGPSLNVRMGMAIDLDNGKLWYHTGGTWTGNPAGGSGSSFSGITGSIFLGMNCSSSRSGTIYTDPTLHTYSAPAGFTAGWPSA